MWRFRSAARPCSLSPCCHRWWSSRSTGARSCYLVAREAGFEAEDINIDGLAEAVAFEPLWVLAPVRGLSMRQAVKVGVVELVTGDAGREMLLRFSPRLEAQFADPLEDVGAFALTAVPAKYMHDAELEGLALIDDAMAWLTTRLRYSWSHAPDGQLEPYERAATLTVVERLPGVAVFPVAGAGRRWWRDTTVAQPKQDVELPLDSRSLTPAMPTRVSLGDRQALLALQRAITARDPCSGSLRSGTPLSSTSETVARSRSSPTRRLPPPSNERTRE
jgi:hypothetical protein